MDELTLKLATNLKRRNTYGFRFGKYEITFSGNHFEIEGQQENENYYPTNDQIEAVRNELEEDAKKIVYIKSNIFVIELFIKKINQNDDTSIYDKFISDFANVYILKGKYGTIAIDFIEKNAFAINSDNPSVYKSIYEEAEIEASKIMSEARNAIYGDTTYNFKNLSLYAISNQDDVLLSIIKRCDSISVNEDRTVYDVAIKNCVRKIYFNKDKKVIAISDDVDSSRNFNVLINDFKNYFSTFIFAKN